LASTAVSQLIFFIAAILIASAVVGVLLGAANDLSEGIEGRSGSLSDSLRADIAIINDPVAMPYNATNQTLTLYVLNVGSITLDVGGARAFVNGSFANNTTVYVEGGGLWRPDSVLVMHLHGTALTSGQDALASVVASHGVTSRIEFTVP